MSLPTAVAEKTTGHTPPYTGRYFPLSNFQHSLPFQTEFPLLFLGQFLGHLGIFITLACFQHIFYSMHEKITSLHLFPSDTKHMEATYISITYNLH